MEDVYIPTGALSRAAWRFENPRSMLMRYWVLFAAFLAAHVGYAFLVDYLLGLDRSGKNPRPEGTWGKSNFGDLMVLFVAGILVAWCIIDIFNSSSRIERLLKLYANVQSIILQIPSHVVTRDVNNQIQTQVLRYKNNTFPILNNQAVFELFAMYLKFMVLTFWQLSGASKLSMENAVGTVRNIDMQGGTQIVHEAFEIEVRKSLDPIMSTTMLKVILNRINDMAYASFDAKLNIAAPMLRDPQALTMMTLQIQQRTRELFEIDRNSYWTRLNTAVQIFALIFTLADPFFFWFHQGNYMIISHMLTVFFVGGAVILSYYVGHAYRDATELFTTRVYDSLQRSARNADAQYRSLFGAAYFSNKPGYMTNIVDVYLPRDYASDKKD